MSDAVEVLFIRSMRDLRQAKGWSQGEMARQIQRQGHPGFHQTTVSRIEKGERPVRLGEALAITRALQTDLEHMTAEDARSSRLRALYAERADLIKRVEQLSSEISELDRGLR